MSSVKADGTIMLGPSERREEDRPVREAGKSPGRKLLEKQAGPKREAAAASTRWKATTEDTE